mgnify:CR=1 FL=1|jgi:hypothetical protein|tara:strand:+ start:278 stop:568 length:291 start_codon:yes stop_codon:yes gene_type:complete
MSKLDEVTVANVKNLRDIIISQASMISTLRDELEIAERSTGKYRDWWLEESKKYEATKKELSDMVEVLDVVEQKELMDSHTTMDEETSSQKPLTRL